MNALDTTATVGLVAGLAAAVVAFVVLPRRTPATVGAESPEVT